MAVGGIKRKVRKLVGSLILDNWTRKTSTCAMAEIIFLELCAVKLAEMLEI